MDLKYEEIKSYTKGLSRERLLEIIPRLLEDERSTVRALGKKLQNRIKKEAKEYERINRMKEIERGLKQEGYILIAGIDEAGRGPLAGPVAAAAVILPEGFYEQGVNDSKKLSPQRREYLYHKIIEKAVDYGLGMVDSHEIDRTNILRATYRAAAMAVDKLSKRPDCLLLDAIVLPGCDLFQKSVIKGDCKCLSVAAASIIAKVSRDRFMDDLHKRYPQYNFSQNKGYGTREHIGAIIKHGPCPFHRDTFIQSIRG